MGIFLHGSMLVGIGGTAVVKASRAARRVAEMPEDSKARRFQTLRTSLDDFFEERRVECGRSGELERTEVCSEVSSCRRARRRRVLVGGWLESGGGEGRRSEDVGCGKFFGGCWCCSVETGGGGERGCIGCGTSADIVRNGILGVDKESVVKRGARREEFLHEAKNRNLT